MGKPRRAINADHMGATQETAAKLQPDVIQEAYERQQIDASQLAAFHEICRIYYAFQRALFSGCSKPQKSFGSGFDEPIDRLTDAEAAIWSRKYRPWAQKCPYGIAVVLDAYEFNILPPTSLGSLQRALGEYVSVGQGQNLHT
jgi:hypothetical protein